ncbi:arginine utilization protein RocB [Melghiribacillus thermohalophilus]|uniref:Arginine utilization protein RocB n=1 Tax=Melghiribacillus thermohalophilus TaxID=1324956 RepID=A0A4R3N8G0_9BACI|nr:M20/M25/M40 family metallo-hydrolase [Melghiribacillus thermohalophilus]TCT25663.1 arginine utilization protein RocB [Melghiribacillus thermohalophilus]
MKKWQTKEQLTDLLCSLVQYPSITGSEHEIAIVEYLYHILSEKEYFKRFPSRLSLHPLPDGRQLLTALVKGKGDRSDTVVLLSHIDVVDIEDYGSFKNLAFFPRELTREYEKHMDLLPEEVQHDIRSGEWLFGRGTMDMKAGTALHLSMLEKAMDNEFHGNILLLIVPDEEVNSSGMIHSLPVLNQIKNQENLTYRACLNGEPMFRKFPGDESFYMYMGSLGKVLPGFYCYGKETHAGEPFGGVNANVMISYLNQELELHESFIEKVDDEVTPPPVSLMNRDLKEEYSVQTPISSVSMYNVFYMKQSLMDLSNRLMDAANRAKKKIEQHYQDKGTAFRQMAGIRELPDVHVNVMKYEELLEEAVKRHGNQEVLRRQNLLIQNREQGDRDFSTLLVQDLAYLCKDLAPMIVLFYSPPFYPSVSSRGNKHIEQVLKYVQDKAKKDYDIDLETIEFFPGLSDLSFVGPASSTDKSLKPLKQNMPLDEMGYTLDEKLMEEVHMPILNIGPFGKGAHQWTERLELHYSFEILPDLLTGAIHDLFKDQFV